MFSLCIVKDENFIVNKKYSLNISPITNDRRNLTCSTVFKEFSLILSHKSLLHTVHHNMISVHVILVEEEYVR